MHTYQISEDHSHFKILISYLVAYRPSSLARLDVAGLLKQVLGPVLVDEDVLVPSDVECHEGGAHGGYGKRTLGEGGDVIVARQRGRTEMKDEMIVNNVRVTYLSKCNLNPVARSFLNLQ